MKRYQCIKTTRHELFEFCPGSLYDFIVNSGGNFYGYKTPVGRIIRLTSMEIRECFQELLDLNVDDQEQQAYVAIQPVRGCLRFIAICFASAIAGGLFLYLALIWRS